MKKALVFEKFSQNKVRCLVCQRKCLILEGKTGFCLTKTNQKGELDTLNYGLIQGIQVDPIEKKPFYHFLPGESIPSIGSFGCNFRCKQCLNWPCSWGEPATSILKETAKKKQKIRKPEEIIREIKENGYRGIAFTYNEPVVWTEYVLDCAKLAKKEGLFTLFVTNGSWTKETLDKIGPFLDAANIDFKGFSVETYNKQGGFFGQIPEMAIYAQKKHKIFLEMTTLLIPGINDKPDELKKMTAWIVKNLGAKTPWHLSRFSPQLAPDPLFKKIPETSVESLKKAKEIGLKEGLEFIYIWTGGGYFESDTICPSCGKLAIQRTGWQPNLVNVDNKGNCLSCRESLNLVLTLDRD